MKPSSLKLFEEAKRYLPKGVNSPVRYFDPYPIIVESATGPLITDLDGRIYIDYIMGYGANLFGHSPQWLINAISESIENGITYGLTSRLEIEAARAISETVPGVDKLRMVNSGAEATLHAIRLARAYTGRRYIVKFRGCYHGAHDYVLVEPGSGAIGKPKSPGVLEDASRSTLVGDYNDIEGIEKIMRKHGDEVAAIILEPIAANMGVIPPNIEFLKACRELASRYGSILIFDEIVTGLRIAPGGAQEYFGIEADLVTLGKAMGSGVPVGVYGGRKDIMQLVAPEGPFYQASTFGGNTIASAAIVATIEHVRRYGNKIYGKLSRIASEIEAEAERIAERYGIELTVNRFEGLIQIFMTKHKVTDYTSALASDTGKYMRLHRELLKRGILIPPSQYESWFPSYAHTGENLSETLYALRESLRSLA